MFDDPHRGPVVGEFWIVYGSGCHMSLDEKIAEDGDNFGMELPKKTWDPDMESRTNGILSNAGWLDGLPPKVISHSHGKPDKGTVHFL